CHDMDIIRYVLDKKCERVSSYGSLMHFRKENKPKDAPLRCLDGCPVADACPFHAGRYYLGEGRNWARKFTEDTSNEGILKALHETNYGKCVYQLDNNVVDHQVVNMEFEGGDRKSTRLNSSHVSISYAVFCLKKKKKKNAHISSR